MNKGLLRKILPHLVAVIVFLVISLIYCRPALDGQVLQQHDITQWEGAIHQSQVFKEQHGHMPLWTNSMFGGMPTFQIGTEYNNKIPAYVQSILTLGLPAPVQFFFLACICFYFLSICLKVNPYIGILGALGFAYATYNPVIIVAGHATKMWAMAYMPAVLGSIILIFDRRYWIGTALTALFTATMIAMNHPQIAYYFFITAFVMTLFYIINWIRRKEFKHLAISLGLVIVAGVTGLLVNAGNLLSTYEYQKETIRGGASALTDTTRTDTPPQSGLDKDYAFGYSFSMTEPFVMLVPRIFGGSSGKPEIKSEDSKAIEALQSLPQQLQQQLPMSYYWGGISSTGPTSGPPYSGAIICFLAILAFFVLDQKHKWWILTATLLFCVISMGSYFKEFNDLLYYHLPFYNKFRAPSMALVIPQLLLPVLAVLSLNAVIVAPDRSALLPLFRKALIATGAVFVVLLALYFSYDYLSPNDTMLLKNVRDANQPQLLESVKTFFDGLVADRKSLFMGDILRSFGFILLAAAFIWLLIRKVMSPALVIAGLALFTFIDLIVIDNHYLNAENYEPAQEDGGHFALSKADNEILADKSYFRVFNFSSDAFAEAYTSYHYNSLGGYHAVKLRLYQDLIERQFSSGQPNMAVLNMLNAKYFIQKDQNGITQQYQKNDAALGNAWLVSNIVYVKDADAEMNAISNFSPKDTAFVQESFRASIASAPAADSSATITLTANLNDQLTYDFKSTASQFAVFSEIYYQSGWKAFIDGREAPIVKTDYVLRGLAVPAGTHKIEFRFEPSGYATGEKLTTVFTIILIILLVGGIVLEWRDGRKGAAPVKTVVS